MRIQSNCTLALWVLLIIISANCNYPHRGGYSSPNATAADNFYEFQTPIHMQNVADTHRYNCRVKYPIIGSHGHTDNGEPEYAYGKGGLSNGIYIENRGWSFHSFYTIPETLKKYGLPNGWFTVPDKDTYVSVFERANQLREHILYILTKTAPETDPVKGWVDKNGNLWKINIIAHCQGGHEAVYLASENCPLDDGWGIPMYKRIASITTLSTAHSGHVLFDVFYCSLAFGHLPTLPTSISNIQNYIEMYMEKACELYYGTQGDEFLQSLYYLTTFYLRDFKRAYPPSHEVYVQGFGAKISNIWAKQFTHDIAGYFIIKLYYDMLPGIDGDNDSITHPIEAAAGYYNSSTGKIMTIEGMENYRYRGTLTGEPGGDGVSHRYLNDSPVCYRKSLKLGDVFNDDIKKLVPSRPDLLWVADTNDPDEPQIGFSSKKFFVRLVDELRRMGF